MKDISTKKIIIVFISMILILYGAVVVVSGYLGYVDTFILKDSKDTRTIRNIMRSHDKNISHLNLLSSEYNLALESFGGTERAVYDKNNKDIISTNDEVVKKYADYYRSDFKDINNEEELYNKIAEKYRYYNEDMLEIYLLFYKRYTGNELKVNDIKSYVDEGNTDSQDEIWEYIEWFSKGSVRKGFLECRFKDSEELDKLDKPQKNNYRKFDDLSLSEKKEFIKNLGDLEED